MLWLSKVLAPAVLILGIAGSAALMAEPDGNQPPFGKGPKGGDKKVEGKKGDRKGDEKKGPVGDKQDAGPKADPVVDAWVTVLIAKITDPHDTVRDSARGALVSVGPAALPVLQKLADGDDPAKAVAARKLIAAIHAHHGHHGQHGQHGQHGPAGSGGRPHFGAGGPGGFPGGPGGRGGMGPHERGPGGFPGTGPGGGRPGREEEERDAEVAPVPRDLAIR